MIDEQEVKITHSPKETQDFARALSKELKPKDIIAFKGDLGMGKTTFTVGLAEGLGFEGYVSSPTFTIINEYRGGRLNLCHVDAYRLSCGEDLFEVGVFDYLDRGWVIACEWSENVIEALSPTLIIEIGRIDDNVRQFTLTRRG